MWLERKEREIENSTPPVGLEPTTSEWALRLKCMEGCVDRGV